MFDSERWGQFAAMAMIGDGIMAVVNPRRDAEAWRMGPRPWRMLMRRLRRHPTLTRVVGLGEIAGGVCWALHSAKRSRRRSAMAREV